MDDLNAGFNRKLESLKQEFKPRLIEQLIEVKNGLDEYDVQHIYSKDFISSVHKLIGSAGMYGFDEASLFCKELESKLEHRSVKSTQESARLVKRLAHIIEGIKSQK